jgi:protein-glutamine gamma-glutamyltransferase
MDFAAMKRVQRIVQFLPVFAALGLNAVAHGRWLFDAPVMLGLFVALALGVSTPHRGGRMLLVGAAGGALGFAALLLAAPPQGPIPPVVLSPLCMALVGLSAFCTLSGNRPFAWVYAWLLAVLSANAGLTFELAIALMALAVATILALASAGRLDRVGFAGLGGFGVFFLLTVVGTWQLTLLIRASEGWLMESLAAITSSGVKTLEAQSVDLPTRTTAPLSMAPLFELEGPPPRYLRTAVLEYFDGRRWWETQARREEKLKLPGGQGEPLTVSFLAPLGKSLPAPAGVRDASGAPIDVRGGWVLQSEELGGRTVRLSRGPEVLPEEEPPADADKTLPEEVAQQLAPLAEEVLGGSVTPKESAQKLEHFFASNFTYSLTVDLSGPEHPLARLVKERRPAYCSYFASAMVALLRTRGVAARLVTGFAPAETNKLTGRTVIRSRDAHAWVEVYLPEEKRWAAFDPTPWSTRDEALLVQREKGWASNAFDAVLSALRRAWAKVRYTPGDAVVAVASSPFTWLVVIGAALYVFRRRLTFARRAKSASFTVDVEPRLRDAYRAYVKLLARAGLTPAAAETDDELISRLRAASGEKAASAAQQFMDVFRRERFRAAENAPMDEALKKLETELGTRSTR